MKLSWIKLLSFVFAVLLPLNLWASERPRVVVTTTMLTEMVTEIAGDDFEVRGLMGPGSDPHIYRLTTRDLRAILDSDLLVLNGLRLEGRMGQALAQAEQRGKRVLSVGEHLPPELLLEDDEVEGEKDPHIWGDVNLWRQVIPLVRDQLSAVRPDAREQIASRAAELDRRYEELDGQIRTLLSVVPERSRLLITSHDAFGYFGRAYDLEVQGIQGLSTASEAGLADLTRLSRLIRERGVRTVFPESTVSPSLVERLSSTSGASVGPELFSDAMGAPDERRSIAEVEYEVGTYPGMMLYNAAAITEGLRSE